MDEVNKNVFYGIFLVYVDGEVFNFIIELDELNEYMYGEMVYFFEKVCVMSGYLFGVNFFD